jgi:hypothetical protein
LSRLLPSKSPMSSRLSSPVASTPTSFTGPIRAPMILGRRVRKPARIRDESGERRRWRPDARIGRCAGNRPVSEVSGGERDCYC